MTAINPLSVCDHLKQPVAADSLLFFRRGLGIILIIMWLRFWWRGWINTYYIQPSYYFSYWGFEWVQPWPGLGMYIHILLLIVCAAGIALGYGYRTACWLSVIGFGYVELIDKTPYLNHHYALWVLVFVLAWLPLNGKPTHVPRAYVWLIRFQVGLIYTFAGIAKLNHDWLIQAEPLRHWLSALGDLPVIGPFLLIPILPWLMAWAGMLFDISIAGWLLYAPTRRYAFVVLVVFHVLTALLFPIGVFPWIMILNALIFFAPDWPHSWKNRRPKSSSRSHDFDTKDVAAKLLNPWQGFLLGGFIIVQIFVPLRHWLYPGNVLWTEEGFRFSWSVMLIEKTGSVEFKLLDPHTGQFWWVNPTDELTPFQNRMMSTQPDMIHQYAQHLGQRWQKKGYPEIKVYAEAYASLNGRPSQLLIDPQADLMAIPRSFKPQPFIVPLKD